MLIQIFDAIIDWYKWYNFILFTSLHLSILLYAYAYQNDDQSIIDHIKVITKPLITVY